jgi:hypothetical protein
MCSSAARGILDHSASRLLRLDALCEFVHDLCFYVCSRGGNTPKNGLVFGAREPVQQSSAILWHLLKEQEGAGVRIDRDLSATPKTPGYCATPEMGLEAVQVRLGLRGSARAL